jgi:hypothetical protein
MTRRFLRRRAPRRWVRQCGDRFFERHLVFPQVRSGLSIVPFEVSEDDRRHRRTMAAGVAAVKVAATATHNVIDHALEQDQAL